MGNKELEEYEIQTPRNHMVRSESHQFFLLILLKVVLSVVLLYMVGLIDLHIIVFLACILFRLNDNPIEI